MSASDHLNGEQLRMFMTPREILETHSPLDADRLQIGGRTVGNEHIDRSVWRRKYVEATVGRVENAMHQGIRRGETSLAEHVAAHGVQEPVGLGQTVSEHTGRPMLTSGHHRVAAAFVSRPDEPLPVLHFADVKAHRSDPVWGGQRYR